MASSAAVTSAGSNFATRWERLSSSLIGTDIGCPKPGTTLARELYGLRRSALFAGGKVAPPALPLEMADDHCLRYGGEKTASSIFPLCGLTRLGQPANLGSRKWRNLTSDTLRPLAEARCC